MGPKEDAELQLQIEANGGIFEPLLLEPHPEFKDKYRIIDGDRRWTNSKVLVEKYGKEAYRSLPAEITDRTLSDEERYRVWVYIHRQRKEWDTKEKEMVAYQLVNLFGRASAANIIGITVREIDKFVEVYELSDRLTGIADPGASITWARELRNISRKLMTPSIVNAVVQKVNDKKVTNSKHLRKLRVFVEGTWPAVRSRLTSIALRCVAPAAKFHCIEFVHQWSPRSYSAHGTRRAAPTNTKANKSDDSPWGSPSRRPMPSRRR